MQIEIYQNNNQTRSLPLKSLAYYILGILQIFIAYKLQNSGEKVYFYVFWSIFGFDKIITIMIGITHRRSITFYLADILQLGFLYIIFSDDMRNEMSNVLTIKYYINTLLLLIFQIVFLFGYHIIFDPSLEVYLIILLYGVYISTITFFLCLFMNLQDNNYYSFKKHCKFMITFGANILCISSFLFTYDLNGTNLGYYLLCLIGFNVIVLTIWSSYANNLCCQTLYKSTKETIYCQLFSSISYIYNSQTIQQYLCRKNIQNMDYVNKLIEFSLMLVFPIITPKDNIYTQKSYIVQDIIKLIQIILTLLILFINICYFSQQTYFNIFKFISLHIYTTQGLSKAIKMLKQNQLNIKQLFISFNSNLEKFQQNSNQNSIIQEPFINSHCSPLCKKQYILLKIVSQYLENNIEVELLDCLNKLCKCCSQQIMSEERCFIDLFLENPYFYNQNLAFILLQRHFNGFLNTTETLKLEKVGKLSQNERKVLLGLKVNLLQISIFDKSVKQQMLYSPSQILYDLYS